MAFPVQRLATTELHTNVSIVLSARDPTEWFLITLSVEFTTESAGQISNLQPTPAHLHMYNCLWEGLLFVGCLTSQQQASVSQGRICSDNNFTCCHAEIEVADQTFYLTQSQYTDTGPTSPSADPITPGAWQGSHWSANV